PHSGESNRRKPSLSSSGQSSTKQKTLIAKSGIPSLQGGEDVNESDLPSYTLNDLLAGITSENRYEAVDFGVPQGRERL
ncbi:MAG: hypothetical protein WAW42_14835, partial [Candidatus Competibacteraceae bacterium]